MPTISITSNLFPAKKEKTRNLFWYDTKNKIMYKGAGTNLSFEYNKEQNRMLPRVITAEKEISIKGITKDILRWFYNYQNIYDSEAELIYEDTRKNVVLFEIPDEEIDDFINQIDRKKFKYNYE